ncbi:MAG: glycosyltransferase family 39 protein [Actinobacteria bacterium]|nr:glycosyltransferase family 39 protein [Actinomycetota bacterium]
MSILGGAISVVLIFIIGKSIFNREVGITAAILLLFSPLVWSYAEISLSYEVEMPLVLASVWFLYQMYYHRRYSVATAILIGLAAGVREDFLLFLGPFFIVASIRIGGRSMLLSWLAILAAILTWLIPITHSVGSFTNLRYLYSQQFNIAIRPTSFLAIGYHALINNGKEIFKDILWFLGLTTIVLALAVIQFFKKSNIRGQAGAGLRALFIMLLTVPAFFYFLLFQTEQPSFIVSYLAPFMLVVAYLVVLMVTNLTMKVTFAHRNGGRNVFGMVLAGLLVIISLTNSYLFLHGLGQGNSMFFRDSLRGFQNSETRTRALLNVVKQFDPNKTVIICKRTDSSEDLDWRRLMYYLPDYRVVGLVTDEPLLNRREYHDAQHHEASLHQQADVVLSSGMEQALFIDIAPDGQQAPSRFISFSQDKTIKPIIVVNITNKKKLVSGSYLLRIGV